MNKVWDCEDSLSGLAELTAEQREPVFYFSGDNDSVEPTPAGGVIPG